jgi:hypothetical protein
VVDIFDHCDIGALAVPKQTQLFGDKICRHACQAGVLSILSPLAELTVATGTDLVDFRAIFHIHGDDRARDQNDAQTEQKHGEDRGQLFDGFHRRLAFGFGWPVFAKPNPSGLSWQNDLELKFALYCKN